MSGSKLNIAEVRARLAASGGDSIWRSLEELSVMRRFANRSSANFPRPLLSRAMG